MAYRPYPNADRALRQLGRHAQNAGPWRPDFLFDPQTDSLMPYPGDYVLSTRRDAEAGRVVTLSPGAVSPEAASRFPVDFIEQINQARRPGVVGGPA
jgi:hypothetical protein